MKKARKRPLRRMLDTERRYYQEWRWVSARLQSCRLIFSDSKEITRWRLELFYPSWARTSTHWNRQRIWTRGAPLYLWINPQQEQRL